ncbi:hypothetical protein FXF51_39975 [Nonomuraea sp. PA05]|uniref:hypothetical protein n=1 Tax=Nonomuraea sp. PA05 TaxID=2604466 RepID=UPI0011D8C725|nr:hypothetical protein [Nonomuraea sp. PA05]TYB57675.1 hypothetical protein FXF51_39975 [Nonomuraea sp. PA05]
MNNFFQALATKLAERWVALLFVPGALLVAATWAGIRLGHTLDAARLTQAASTVTASFAARPAGVQALSIATLLLVTTGAGWAVQTLAPVTRGLWLGQWPFLRGQRIARRRARWRRHVERRRRLARDHPAESRTPEQQESIDAAAGRANRVALAQPGRATWMGDRVHAVEQVALDRYGLDLAFAWPRLWLVLPDATRAELNAANAAFAGAVATGTWAWPYLLLGVVWWPAAVAGVVVGVTGWVRARGAIADLSALSEAVLDLHTRTLAVSLGVGSPDAAGPITVAEGEEVTSLVRKGR